MNNGIELLELLRDILNCTYISDLRTDQYNAKARLILELLKFNSCTSDQIDDALTYLNAPLE